MQQTLRALPLFAVLLLAGCSMGPSTSDVAVGPTLPAPNSAMATGAPMPAAPAALEPVQTVATASSASSDVSTFVDAAIVGQLTARDRSEAGSAQFNALTFGRPGAPRTWSGDKGTTGSITVGPYVQINSIMCRTFTHTVTIGGTAHPKQGTACKDPSGSWNVEG